MHPDIPREQNTSVPGISSWQVIFVPWLLMSLAWALLLVALASNHAFLLSHDYLLRASHLPWMLALPMYTLAWQIMIVAMMIPSSFSAFVWLSRSVSSYQVLWRHQLAFLMGYVLVWTSFALLVFIADTGLHWLAAQWRWLYLHPWTITVAVLLLTGLFQFLPWKRRCLNQCIFIAPHALPDLPGAEKSADRQLRPWLFGLRYGYVCLSSCWAIMLLMAALDMHNLLWQALLTAVMLIEKEVPGGTRLRPWFGVVFLSLALLLSVGPVLSSFQAYFW